MKKFIATITSFLIATVSSLSMVSCSIPEMENSIPVNWYTPYNTEDGSSNAFANDACSILWDE